MVNFNKNWKSHLLEQEFDRTKLSIKDKLNPKFWKRGALEEETAVRLMEIAQDFYSSIQESIREAPDFEDITFTGSLASYNYHNSSDIDLHIVVDFAKIEESKEILSELFALERIRWNDSHNIRIYGHEVEIYIQDSNEEHFANGVYSILRREWVDMPTKEDVDIDFKTTEKKYESLSLEIKELSKLFKVKEFEKVHSHAIKLKEKIKIMRISGLEAEGVYSPENLAFKMLRNSHEIEKLMSLKSSSYDKMMSLTYKDKKIVDIAENWQKYLDLLNQLSYHGKI